MPVTAPLTGNEKRLANLRPFKPGQSGNRSGLPKSQMLATEFEAAELGGCIAPADRLLLQRAFSLLTRRTRSPSDSVRSVNTVHRILRSLRAKYPQPEPPVPTLESYRRNGVKP
jgi:hypothetical protein